MVQAKKAMPVTLGGLLLAVLVIVFGGDVWSAKEPTQEPGAAVTVPVERAARTSAPSGPTRAGPSGARADPSEARADEGSDPTALVRHADIGFTSRASLADHFEKHGREFGALDRAQYLLRAQALRDRPLGKSVFQKVRDDGVMTRFDTQSGEFLAFNEDLTIRTFFKPDDGWRYFERQSRKDHE